MKIMLPFPETLLSIMTEDRWYSELELVTLLPNFNVNTYQISKVHGVLDVLVKRNRLVKKEEEGVWYYRKEA